MHGSIETVLFVSGPMTCEYECQVTMRKLYVKTPLQIVNCSRKIQQPTTNHQIKLDRKALANPGFGRVGGSRVIFNKFWRQTKLLGEFLQIVTELRSTHGWIQDPIGGGAKLPEGIGTYDFTKISKKLHEIIKILDRGEGDGEGGVPGSPPKCTTVILHNAVTC